MRLRIVLLVGLLVLFGCLDSQACHRGRFKSKFEKTSTVTNSPCSASFATPISAPISVDTTKSIVSAPIVSAPIRSSVSSFQNCPDGKCPVR